MWPNPEGSHSEAIESESFLVVSGKMMKDLNDEMTRFEVYREHFGNNRVRKLEVGTEEKMK